MATDTDIISPSGTDMMIIILSSKPSQTVQSIARCFYKSNVLTVIISTDKSGWDRDSCDSIASAIADENSCRGIPGSYSVVKQGD